MTLLPVSSLSPCHRKSRLGQKSVDFSIFLSYAISLSCHITDLVSSALQASLKELNCSFVAKIWESANAFSGWAYPMDQITARTLSCYRYSGVNHVTMVNSKMLTWSLIIIDVTSWWSSSPRSGKLAMPYELSAALMCTWYSDNHSKRHIYVIALYGKYIRWSAFCSWLLSPTVIC